jgi:hypothetical protein
VKEERSNTTMNDSSSAPAIKGIKDEGINTFQSSSRS